MVSEDIMCLLPKDSDGNPLGFFSPVCILTDQTSIETSESHYIAIMPETPSKLRVNGASTYLMWPAGTPLGLAGVWLVEFQMPTNVFVMR